MSNIIRNFAAYFVPLTDALLVEAYDWVIDQDGDVKGLMQDDVVEAMIAAVTIRG